MKKLIVLVAVCLSSVVMMGQTTEDIQLPEFKHSIGFDAGGSNGYGFSYRYWPGKWGVQVNTFPYITPKTYDVSFGVSLLHTLYESQKIRFYLYYGNHIMLEKYEDYTYYVYDGYYGNDDPYQTNYKKENTWVTGLGPGFEFFFASRLALNLRFGLGYYFHNSNDWALQPDGGIGLVFRF